MLLFLYSTDQTCFMSPWKSPSHVILVAATPDITSELILEVTKSCYPGGSHTRYYIRTKRGFIWWFTQRFFFKLHLTNWKPLETMLVVMLKPKWPCGDHDKKKVRCIFLYVIFIIKSRNKLLCFTYVNKL